MRIRNHLFGLLFGIVLFGFTAYLLLDTFVIVHKIAAVETTAVRGDTVVEAETTTIEIVPIESAETETVPDEEDPEAAETLFVSSEEPATVETETTDSTYRDENITVTLTDYRLYDTTVHVADVTVTSPEYLKTAFAQSTYGRNVTQKTSTIASSVNAILAINGDYYGAQRAGYVIRNGVLYRATASKNAEDLVIYRDGSFGIINESEITAEELLESGAWDVLSFGPALVENGEIAVTESEEVGRAMASNPRTAIGVIGEGHYVFIVCDGRTDESAGLSLYELAAFMQSLGVTTAYNLDGGGSSSMVFLGNVVNVPTTNGNNSKERSVSDIVYIGY